MRRREPGLARRLLTLLIHRDEVEFILGDLSEDFAEMADLSGEAAARAWYRRQVAWTLLDRLRRPRSFEAWSRELRRAIRALGRAPVFAIASTSSLGLGIGGVVAIATLAHSVLQPLPFPDAARLLAVWETKNGDRRRVAPANYLDFLPGPCRTRHARGRGHGRRLGDPRKRRRGLRELLRGPGLGDDPRQKLRSELRSGEG